MIARALVKTVIMIMDHKYAWFVIFHVVNVKEVILNLTASIVIPAQIEC